jgi:hypothetical protein
MSFEMELLFDERGSVFLCRLYVCYTVVSARIYPRCHDIQITMDPVHSLSLHCNVYTRYTGFSCQWGLCSKTCVTTLSWTVVGLIAAKFKPLILPMSGFSLSTVTYLLIYRVQFADWCAHVKISSSAVYSILQALQFQEWASSACSQVRRV